MKMYWPGAPGEQVDVGLHVLGREGDEVGDGVEFVLADRGAGRGRVADVAAQHVRAVGQRAARRLPAVEHVSSMPRSSASCAQAELICRCRR